MAREDAPARGDLGADGLGDAEDDPASSVPHSEPSPPMITASKPKMSRAGPTDGENVVRIARKTPAIATVASEIAIARLYTRRLLIPTSDAVRWSSEVARSARPI